MKYFFPLLLLLHVYYFGSAQKKNAAYQLHIHKTSEPIKIDGIGNEATWQSAEPANNFFMVLPMDTSHAKVLTDVRMCYDHDNIYILATCYKKIAGVNMVESLRRDFNFQKNDNFIFFIDPFDDQTSGFTFGANADGAQWDGSLYEGGKADLSWDNKWESVVKNDAEKYVFEASIPFKTIRYKKGITEWGINFSRNDLKSPEKSSWTPIPRQFPTASLAYTGTLIWDEPPPDAGNNISLIPYALSGVSKDYLKQTSTLFNKAVGIDAKIAVTSSLNLDLTVHPDFSQVEVDKQVTNLDRYELFFPEKRQFFLENADIFGNFGYANIHPFFSRRIGLAAPIRYGARLSGKLDKNWRIGAMDMQTENVNATNAPAQNFAVVSLQRRVFKRSNIGFIYADKTSLNYNAAADTGKITYSAYNRNMGLEYNLASSNNIWTGKALFLKSFSPEKSGKDFTQAANLQYNSKFVNISWQHEYVGANYNAEAGYVPRHGNIKMNPQITKIFFPRGGRILSHGVQLNSTYFFDTKLHETDDETALTYLITTRKQSTVSLVALHDYVQLLQKFDPTNSGKDSLLIGSKHQWNTVGFDVISKAQQLFTFGLTFRYGGYYANGEKLTITNDLGYRFQPFVSVALSTSYNRLALPKPWGNTTFFLIGPRIDVTMTNKLFFTTFIQYNDQQKNINLNTRLQWRYKPASDFFLVYTDNYYPPPIAVKTRALVLKFTYWWSK